MFASAAIGRAERSDDVRALSKMETCSSAYFGKNVLVKSIRLTTVPSIGVERTSTSTEKKTLLLYVDEFWKDTRQ